MLRLISNEKNNVNSKEKYDNTSTVLTFTFSVYKFLLIIKKKQKSRPYSPV